MEFEAANAAYDMLVPMWLVGSVIMFLDVYIIM